MKWDFVILLKCLGVGVLAFPFVWLLCHLQLKIDGATDRGLAALWALWKRVFGWIGQTLKPSVRMNFRILVPAVLVAMALGACLYWLIADRYAFQAIGNGSMVKTDRWTGEAWMTSSYRRNWEPVK